jgi:chromosome segregation ATPase
MGIESVLDDSSCLDPSSIAGEVADLVTSGLVDNVVEQSIQEKCAEGDHIELKAQVQQLQTELSNVKAEVEFAGAEKKKLEEECELASQTISGLNQQVGTLVSQSQSTQKELAATKDLLAKLSAEKDKLQASNQSLESTLKQTTDELNSAKKVLGSSQNALTDRDELQSQVVQLTKDLNGTREELNEAHKKIAQTGDIPEALAAANEQVAQLNTQIAHLYASLTMARTELEQARSGQFSEDQGSMGAEAAKQNSQIADLVSDIRHLQLDLEYHQQKLDQLIDEKHMMMQQVKKSQDDLTAAQMQIQERDQLLKHKDIDLQRATQEAKSVGPVKEAKLEEQCDALRKEAAAKDSALIVSHYELHKEKLMRDRLEQKNLKLMERLQKLMMVVETQRKENFGLEKQLSTHEKLVDEKDQQLREVTHKAKQLQKAFKAQSAQGLKLQKTPRGNSTSPKQQDLLSQGLPQIA